MAANAPTAAMRRDLIMNAYTKGPMARFTVHRRKLGVEKVVTLVNRSSAGAVKVGMEGGGSVVRERFPRPVGGAVDADAA
jgi:hypothetical protein